MARVALGDRRGIRALKEAVSFVSHRPRQSDDGEQRLTIERARKAYYDMLERSNKDNEITAWLTYFSETVLKARYLRLEPCIQKVDSVLDEKAPLAFEFFHQPPKRHTPSSHPR